MVDKGQGQKKMIGKYDIGARMREIRHERKVSLTEVSAEAGVGVSYLSMLENNKRRVNLEVLEKLAACYEVQLYEFFQRPKRPPSESLEAHLKDLSQRKRRQALRSLKEVFHDNQKALALLKKLA
jgi:transcriptional regulator with XRE-family HTH domain